MAIRDLVDMFCSADTAYKPSMEKAVSHLNNTDLSYLDPASNNYYKKNGYRADPKKPKAVHTRHHLDKIY